MLWGAGSVLQPSSAAPLWTAVQDQPPTLNSSRDNHPESKQGGKAAGPGHAWSESCVLVPCLSLGQCHCTGPVGKGLHDATRLGWLQGMQRPALELCGNGEPQESNQSHTAGCILCVSFSQVGEQLGVSSSRDGVVPSDHMRRDSRSEWWPWPGLLSWQGSGCRARAGCVQEGWW